MNKDEFDDKFEEHLIAKLGSHGFDSQNHHVYKNDQRICVSLIRLGGKFDLPGSIAHVLCMRHIFLPNLDEKQNTQFEKEVFAYPFKFLVSQIASTLKDGRVDYSSHNLKYPFERYEFADASVEDVLAYLNITSNAILRVYEWARTVSYEQILASIEKNGETAWIEKLWAEAYLRKIQET